MHNANDLFMKMCKEAMDDLASGKHGTWREVPPNTLFLASFGMLYNHMAKKVVKPLYLLAFGVIAGVIAFIIMSNGGGG